MENIVISRLEQKHIQEAAKLIQPLHNTMIENRRDTFIPKNENWGEYLATKLQDEDWVMLVALNEDVVVGVCTAEIKHCGDNIDTRVRDILFIDYIAVSEEHRRCKIGTKLLDEIKKIAIEQEISTVELNVWGFNENAIKFYENNKMKPKRIVYEYLIDKE